MTAAILCLGLFAGVGEWMQSQPRDFKPRAVDAPAPLSFASYDGLPLIAHAGGGVPEGAYSNSREALERTARGGFDMVEIDLARTHTGELVLAHSWGRQFGAWFGEPELPWWRERQGYGDAIREGGMFAELPMHGGLTPLVLADLLEWMDAHPDMRVVVDMKHDTLAGYAALVEAAGERLPRFVAQIYAYDELAAVRELGFGDVILTTYRDKQEMGEALTFVRAEGLMALTAPKAVVMAYGQALPEDVLVLTHTVNGVEEAEALRAIGVDGLYTDALMPVERAQGQPTVGARP